MNPIDIHLWHAHNRIQKSVVVSKHIVLRSLRSQGVRLCPYCPGRLEFPSLPILDSERVAN
jgi:hypothetical protein